MRDMSIFDDLYNAEDMILLCQIIKNRFQTIFEKSSYNLRK